MRQPTVILPPPFLFYRQFFFFFASYFSDRLTISTVSSCALKFFFAKEMAPWTLQSQPLTITLTQSGRDIVINEISNLDCNIIYGLVIFLKQRVEFLSLEFDQKKFLACVDGTIYSRPNAESSFLVCKGPSIRHLWMAPILLAGESL